MTPPAVGFDRACLAYGEREIWRELSVAIEEGSFVAVLGPNGSGKTSLLRVILGLTPVDSGRVEVFGAPPQRGNPAMGYIPQQHSFDRDLPLRGRDLVRLGLDGHRWGIGRPDRIVHRKVEGAIASVGAEAYAKAPVGRLSGGEQQRLRIARHSSATPSCSCATSLSPIWTCATSARSRDSSAPGSVRVAGRSSSSHTT